MRIVVLMMLVIGVLAGCAKDTPAPVFSSPDGTWTYTTPDSKISVDFELKTNSSNVLEILNCTIRVNGVSGVAAGTLSGVSLPAINEIKVNANDVGLVYPFYITFINCTINAGFTQIAATAAEYSYPWGSSNTLTAVNVTRK